jgi:hypothetical protein
LNNIFLAVIYAPSDMAEANTPSTSAKVLGNLGEPLAISVVKRKGYNMIVTVIGFSRVDFEDEQKRKIQGTTLYYSCADPRVEGLKAEKVFISNDYELPNLKPNSQLDIQFNQRGKVFSVSPAVADFFSEPSPAKKP